MCTHFATKYSAVKCSNNNQYVPVAQLSAEASIGQPAPTFNKATSRTRGRSDVHSRVITTTISAAAAAAATERHARHSTISSDRLVENVRYVSFAGRASFIFGRAQLPMARTLMMPQAHQSIANECTAKHNIGCAATGFIHYADGFFPLAHHPMKS